MRVMLSPSSSSHSTCPSQSSWLSWWGWPRPSGSSRSRCLRAATASLAVTMLVGLVASTPAAAEGDSGAWRGNKGKIFVSDTEFGQGFASDGAMVSAMRKQSKTAIKGDGAWSLNFMVFLKEAPGATSVNIVYYDISAKPREQVNYSEVSVKPDQKIIQLNGVAVSKDLGFVKGHKYDILATRIIGGKEKIYAKTTVTLK
jgi:hypothetical protein